MEKVIERIKLDDSACIEIGVDFIEQDQDFPFGTILKSNTAKALRQKKHLLNEALKNRIRQRILKMLINGNVPKEFKEYSKLIKSISYENIWSELELNVERKNSKVMKYFKYLQDHKSSLNKE